MASFAIAAIAKDEGHYIDEWVAYHLVRGASQIRIYDNGSSDNTADAVRRMALKLPVELVHWPTTYCDFNATQKSAYLDAALSWRNSVDFVGFFDVDEFLVADGSCDISQTLENFDAEVGAIACQQLLFGSSGEKSYREDLVINRFLRTAPRDYAGHKWFKTIARPVMISQIETVHSVKVNGKQVHADGSELVRSENMRFADNIIHNPMRLHHYCIKSKQEFLRRLTRMLEADLPDSVKENYRGGESNFDSRDRNLNQCEDRELQKFVEQIQNLLASL